jgi:DNA-directed RNA polymerase II subunit RPB2
MTVGHICDMLLGRVSAHAGDVWGDGTPFRDVEIEKISDRLQQHGFERHANERMYNGESGQPLEYAVFVGACFYQKLKHMVTEKIHARSRGAKAFLTQQPLEGRSRDGGLRMGEMERDCALAHGATAVLSDRLFEQSDPYETVACARCGMLAQPSRTRRATPVAVHSGKEPVCNICKGSADIRSIQIPYASKLFLQELMSIGIAPRLILKSSSGCVSAVEGKDVLDNLQMTREMDDLKKKF